VPNRELAHALEKGAPVDVAVDVLVENQQHLGIEVAGARHRRSIGHGYLPGL